MTKVSQLGEIEITPGVMPSTDATSWDIPCWAFTDKVRFDPSTGRARKIGGWTLNTFNYSASIVGTMRTIFSTTINQKVYTIIGTNSNLYSLLGSSLVNITPLQTVSVAAANSLATNYTTLANNPITTINGSLEIVINDTSAPLYAINDLYTLSGSTDVNGILAAAINTVHVIRGISGNNITVRVATAATSGGAGGGAAVVRSSGLITLTKAAHGLTTGERVKVSGAANTGGILAASINKEFIIRNITTDTFAFMTAGTATSSVSAAGGAATVYFPQLVAGNLNQGQGQGYGAGLYGVGLYGTALLSTGGETYPQIWFIDRFGENIILTAGNETKVYSWDGDTEIAPTAVTNAPTDINYSFVSNNILVTFGHDVENKIFSSDIGDITQWTASSTNQVYEDIVEGADRFISSTPIDGANLIFTEQETYLFKYIGLPLIWQTQILDSNIGLISPNARTSVNGIAYWMGQENFYMFRGGKVETIPSNFGPQSSILKYVFGNINYSQRYKFFAWYNENFDEIWFHYASAQSNECDRVARLNRKLSAWCPDTFNRTAAEAPVISLSNPRLGNVGTLYTHEAGNDDNGAPLTFTMTTRKFTTGTNTGLTVNVIPDMVATGNVDVELNMYNYPQSATAMTTNNFSVTQTTELVPLFSNGRFWDLSISGDDLGQSFLMGQWLIDQQSGARAK